MKIYFRFRMLILLIISIITSTILTVSSQATDSLLIPQIYGELSFQDIHDLWCEESIILCCQSGLLKGTSSTSFSPNESLTYAQITVIAARLQNLLHGGNGIIPHTVENAPWYLSAQISLAQTGSLPENLNWQLENQPTASCRRNIFVKTLAAVLEKTNTVLPTINKISVLPDCDDPAVLSFYQAGILGGTDRWGSFQGIETLTRGQAATILSRIINPEQRLLISLVPFNLCEDILQVSPGLVLFKVNDKRYTAEQYALAITKAIIFPPMHSEPVPEQIIQDLYPFCYNFIAVETLAEKQNIGLTVEESKNIILNAEAKAGYRGLSSAYWIWVDQILLLEEKLQQYYGEHGDDFDAAREKTAAALRNAVIIAPELYALDLIEIQEHMKNYPESYWY